MSKVSWRNAEIIPSYEMDMVDLEAVDEAGGSAPSSTEPIRVRTEFPETWLWSESSVGYHI